ncbi:unnamed protein product [Mytilus edulis]|uniref:SAP domain-containing protein n=1 Tax=Mytilus edulis TaxID=6550 RepID=A0A8S3QN85_MYTED|nr:unnamed protein product [Mytilus edulis]
MVCDQKRFSFEIKPSGEIIRIFYYADEHPDVLVAKKGFAALFSSKLQHPDNEAVSDWTYQTQEYGNEGHHTASYSVIKTADGIQFKKSRESNPIPNAKGVHHKVLHFDHDLGTVKRVVVDEEFTSPKIAPELVARKENYFYYADTVINYFVAFGLFDAEKNMRKVKAVNDFNDMENPTMSATNKGELKFLKKERIKEKSYRPIDDIVTDSIHFGDVEQKEYNAQKSTRSAEVSTCFHNILEALVLLPDNHLKELAREYFTTKTPFLSSDQEKTEIMIDAFASLCTDLSETLLANFIIYCEEPQPELVMRLFSHIPEFSKPPHQSIVSAIEDICFKRGNLSKSLYTEKLYQRALLTLGIVVNQISKAGDQKTATDIIEQVHQKLGLHDPWTYKVKRAIQTDEQQVEHDHWKAADRMLETALYDEDENVRYEALLLYQAHPKSKVISPLNNRFKVTVRQKRGFWEDGFKFRIATPSVDWLKKVGNKELGASFGIIIENYLDLKVAPLSGHFKVSAHDEAYATVHLGMIGVNVNLFIARLCFKGNTTYNFNLFQEGNGKELINMILRFDKVIKDIVTGIKKGINLFKEIISGKVADLRSRARKAVTAIGRFDENQLPAFFKKVKSVVHRVEKLFNAIKNDVMVFYNKLDESVNVKLPVLGGKLYKGVVGIIEGFKIIGKNPKVAIFKIGLGVFQVFSAYKDTLKVKKKTQEASFLLKDKKPYWWSITDEYKEIISDVKTTLKAVKDGAKEWIEDVKEDPIASFTKGNQTMSKVRESIIKDIVTTLEELSNPFNTILKNLSGPFADAYESTFGVFKYELGKSLIDGIFGTKAHPDFPRTIRMDTDGCKGQGFFPSRLWSGDPEYTKKGIDLLIEEGEEVVAPFSGYIMLTDNRNEVMIKADDSFKNAKIYISNVIPKESILHPSDDDYIQNMKSLKECFSKVKTAVNSEAFKGLKDMFITLIKKAEAFFEKFSLKKLKLGSIIEYLDRLGMTETKEKLAVVLKTIRDLIDNKPCLNPAQTTDEELKQELSDRGHSTTGTREQMISRLTKPDNRCPWMAISTPGNIFCMYDPMCLGVECCLNVKLFMFLYTVKKATPDMTHVTTLNVGLQGYNYTIRLNMGNDGISNVIRTGFNVDFLDLVCLIKYKIQKSDIGLIASIGVGFCDHKDTDDCVAYINLLDKAVLPIPICKSDGKVSWPQDCKKVIPLDVIFVVDESESVEITIFRDLMDALVDSVEKIGY